MVTSIHTSKYIHKTQVEATKHTRKLVRVTSAYTVWWCNGGLEYYQLNRLLMSRWLKSRLVHTCHNAFSSQLSAVIQKATVANERISRAVPPANRLLYLCSTMAVPLPSSMWVVASTISAHLVVYAVTGLWWIDGTATPSLITRSAALQRAIGQEMQTCMGRVLTESVAVDQTCTGGVLVNGSNLAHGTNKTNRSVFLLCLSSVTTKVFGKYFALFEDNTTGLIIENSSQQVCHHLGRKLTAGLVPASFYQGRQHKAQDTQARIAGRSLNEDISM